MAETNPLLTVALLAVPESTASTLYGMYDLLASVGHDWDLITRGTPGPQKIRPIIVSADGNRICVPNGLWIEPECALSLAARNGSPNTTIRRRRWRRWRA